MGICKCAQKHSSGLVLTQIWTASSAVEPHPALHFSLVNECLVLGLAWIRLVIPGSASCIVVNSCPVAKGAQSRHCSHAAAQPAATQVPGVLDVLEEAALKFYPRGMARVSVWTLTTLCIADTKAVLNV